MPNLNDIEREMNIAHPSEFFWIDGCAMCIFKYTKKQVTILGIAIHSMTPLSACKDYTTGKHVVVVAVVSSSSRL